jgi:peptidoglycan hydrolase-like protein with peptidoglycan-binding domain
VSTVTDRPTVTDGPTTEMAVTPPPPPPGGPVGAALTRRGRWKLVAGLGALLALAVGAVVVGGRRTQSPEEVAAASQPPPLSAITAPVERRPLQSKIVLRATVESVDPVDVSCTPAAASGAAGSPSAAGSTPVFTRRPPAPGSTVSEGQVLAEVGGRPVLVVQGETPAFREITPGLNGADIRQLQEALTRLGFDPHQHDGTFGAGTQAAVAAWYRAAGYAAVGPSKEESTSLRAAEAAVEQAEGARQTAQGALDTASQPPARGVVLQAEIAFEQAQAQLDRAQAAGEDTRLAELNVEQARTALDKVNAPPDTTAARAALTEADKRLARARNELAAVNATVGTKVPFCEVVFVPTLPAVLDDTQGGSSGQDASGQGQGDTGSAKSGGHGEAGATWASISRGELVLRGTVDGGERELLHDGMAAQFGEGTTAGTGKVHTTAATMTSGGASFTISPDKPFAGDALGTNLRVVIPVGATSGEVLVVPLAAVSARVDGGARVTRVDPGGEVEVPVKAGLSADGYVEIEPQDGGRLQPGDKVLVGR